MDIRSAPLLPPALAFVSGTALSFHLSHLSIPLLVSLLAVSLLPGRRAGSTPGPAFVLTFLRQAIFALALGLLWTAVREDLPHSEAPGWHPERPVGALVQTGEPWRRSRYGWSARVEIRRLRQASSPGGLPRIGLRPLTAYLSLPGDEPPPTPGSRLRIRGYLRRSPGLDNGTAPVAGPWRLSTPSRRFVEVESGPGLLASFSHRLRRKLEAVLDLADGSARGSVAGSPGAALARALVLGDPSRLDPSTVRGLRRSGLGHLLALSGLHLGLMAGLAWGLAAALRLPQPLRWTAVVAAVALYVLVAGPRPSLLRAAVLVTAGVAALLLERPPSPANALALAMVLLVAHRPALVGDLGFQLTMAATGGLLVLAPWWLRRGGDDREEHESPARGLGVLQTLTASLAAQVATLPWALPAFHGVSPLAAPLNLVAIPWTALVLTVSVIWLGLAALAPSVSVAMLPLLDLLAAPLAWPARVPTSGWWFIPLDLPAPASAALAIGLAALLGLPAHWRETRSRRALAVLGLTALGAAVLLTAGARQPVPRHPRLVVLDVGQGDAVLIQDGGRAVLVDGGGFPGGLDFGGGIGSRVLLPALLRLGVRRLDVVVLTHPDRDHCGGLVELGSWLPVAEVWSVPGWEGEPCVDALLATPGAERREISAGGRGRIGRWRWLALHPTVPSEEGSWSGGPSPGRPRNGGSLVLALSVARDPRSGLSRTGAIRVLLTGDLDAAAEARLLRRFRGPARRLLRAEILKVAHHGSRGSSSLPFLSAVFGPSRDAAGSPGTTPLPLAVISCGLGNPYGHPAPEVLERLRRWQTRVLRTDLQGQIRVSAGFSHPADDKYLYLTKIQKTRRAGRARAGEVASELDGSDEPARRGTAGCGRDPQPGGSRRRAGQPGSERPCDGARDRGARCALAGGGDRRNRPHLAEADGPEHHPSGSGRCRDRLSGPVRLHLRCDPSPGQIGPLVF